MPVEIRETDENELPTCAEIIRQSFKTVADDFGLTKENASTNGAFLANVKLLDEYHKGIKMFGLFDTEKQIGFFALDRNDETFYLEKLSVLPAYRHQGYGKLLLDSAKEYVKKVGGKIISIGIIHANKRLLEWYRTYGFEETGTKIFPHLPFTVCFMKLSIC
jgi:ribosomal protein S18 acetylase RimI-like enzyme